MKNDRTPSVSLEDLLKLKRAETPPPEFWPQFERQLREKQLAAIVEKRPWWCALPGLYVFVVRRRFTLAAGASVLALGMVSLNVYEASRSNPAFAVSDSQLAAAATLETSAPAVAMASASPSAGGAAQAEAVPVANTTRAARPSARLAVLTGQPLPVIPLLDDMPQSGATERFESLSRSLGGDLAGGGLAVPAGARTLLVSARDFGSRSLPTRASVTEPLAQMQAPAEHRSHLLAEVYPTMATSGYVVAPPSERVLSTLSDDRLYSSGGRYDLATERDAIKLSIRF
jgi:hypothetical protein